MIRSLNHLRYENLEMCSNGVYRVHDIYRDRKDGKLLRRFVRKERRGNENWQYANAPRCDGGKELCIIDDSVLMRSYRSHSSQCKMHRRLQVSRVNFVKHCEAKGRKSESVIRLLYKICRSDHTGDESRNEFITGINSPDIPYVIAALVFARNRANSVAIR